MKLVTDSKLEIGETKMKKIRIISAFLTLVMVLSSLTVGIEAAWADKVDDDGNPIINYLTEEYTTPEAKLADMVMVKEQDNYQLWYEEFTGEVALLDTLTGQILFSNPYDIASSYNTASQAVKQRLLSQILITYFENEVQKDMNSYVEAALRGQIVKKNIKNGIRVEYTLGEEQTVRLVPRLINKERYEELIYNNIDNEFLRNKLDSFYTPKDPNDENLTERGIAEMQAKFPITLEMAVYVCDPDIKARELRELENTIKTYCPLYTYEELDYDHDLTNYTGDDAAPPRFRMALEYTLNETGLEVRLPANGISFDESAYQFKTVTILPFMGAGSNEFTGYTFIPDGSGALIRFENLKGTGYNVAGQMYGADYAYHEISGQHSEVMRWPVYGIVTNYDKEVKPVADDTATATTGTTAAADTTTAATDTATATDATDETPAEEDAAPKGIFYDNGFLAVITEGDSLATLMSEHGGTVHPYNTVYASITPRPSDTYNLADSISVSGNATWTVTSSRKYTESYRIRYIMLRDPEICEEKGIKDYYAADYVGMANAYRDYLTASGVISKLENTKSDIPMYIESFGSIETMERVASFPVYVDTPLTTFEDIKTMYDELTELGVGNLNFKLTGFANGGMDHTYPYKLKWVKAVGGNDGFKDLVSYATEKGFDVYPDFDFAYIDMFGSFSGVSLKKHGIRTIDDRYTVKRSYDAATQSFDRGFGGLAVSPVFYEHFYNKFGPNYLEYNNSSIAVSTLGTDLNSDFDEDDPYHREDNKNYTVELLEKMDADYSSVMIEGGNAYAIKYADVITSMSLTSSKFVKASESIPFMGMVLHGSKVFTGTPTNMEGDINESILRAIENGAGMYFLLSYENTNRLKEDVEFNSYYSVAYDIWKEDLVNYYTTLNDATKDLQTSLIVDHEFLSANRVPDADELEDDRLAEEAAKLEEEEAAAKKAEAAERAERLAERLARQSGDYVEPEETVEPTEAEPAETEADAEEADANLDEYGEEIVIDEEEEEVVLEKYATTSGSVVRVEYEGGVNFILNYNSFAVEVIYNGTAYTIDSLSFIRID